MTKMGIGGVVDSLRRVRWLRAMLLHPAIARPGYWFATGTGFVWGAVMGLGHVKREGGVVVAARMPKWTFGRGGTTIGAVFLTKNNISPAILEHEAVHRAQWRKYGLAFIPLYLAAGQDPLKNRFEIEAGLKKGGYV
jgi:hypothetical protein